MTCNIIRDPGGRLSGTLESEAERMEAGGERYPDPIGVLIYGHTPSFNRYDALRDAAHKRKIVAEMRAGVREDPIAEPSVRFICGDIKIDICHRSGCGRASDLLCDYPVGRGKTCDLAMCPNHAHNVGEELDLCELHFREWQAKAKVSRVNPWPPRR